VTRERMLFRSIMRRNNNSHKTLVSNIHWVLATWPFGGSLRPRHSDPYAPVILQHPESAAAASLFLRSYPSSGITKIIKTRHVNLLLRRWLQFPGRPTSAVYYRQYCNKKHIAELIYKAVPDGSVSNIRS